MDSSISAMFAVFSSLNLARIDIVCHFYICAKVFEVANDRYYNRVRYIIVEQSVCTNATEIYTTIFRKILFDAQEYSYWF